MYFEVKKAYFASVTIIAIALSSGCSESVTNTEFSSDSDAANVPEDSEDTAQSDLEDTSPAESDEPLDHCAAPPEFRIEAVRATEDATYTIGTIINADEEVSIFFGEDSEATLVSPTDDTIVKKYIIKTDTEGRVVWSSSYTVKGPWVGYSLPTADFYPVGDSLYFAGYLDGVSSDTSSIVFGDNEHRLECPSSSCYGIGFTAKLNSTGKFEWVRENNIWPYPPYMAAVTADGGLIISSEASAETTFETENSTVGVDETILVAKSNNNKVLVKYDENGNVAFIRQISVEDGSIDMITLPDGSAAFFGAYKEEMIFTDGSDTPLALTSYSNDAYTGFLARYDTDGNLVFAKNTFSNVSDEALTVSDEALFVSGPASDTIHIEDGDLSFDIPYSSDESSTGGIAVFTLDGALKATAGFDAANCKVLSAILREDGINVLKGCGGDSDDEGYEIVGLKFDNTGTEVAARSLARESILDYWNSPRIGVKGELNSNRSVVSINDSHRQTLEWGEGDTSVSVPQNLVFETGLGIFDNEFELIAAHDIRTVRNIFADNSGVYIHAANDIGFVHFDDFISISNISFIAKYSDVGTPDWIVPVGTPKSVIQTAASQIRVITSIVEDATTIGGENTAVTLTPKANTQIVYVVALDKTSGDLLSVQPVLSLGFNQNADCEYSVPTQCTDDSLTFPKVEPLRDPPLPVELNRDVWQEAVSWVDPSCIEICGADETCTVKASCSQDNGAVVEMSFEDIRIVDVGYLYEDFVIKNLTVQLKEGSADWTRLALSEERYTDDEYDSPALNARFQIEWTGALFDSLPENSLLDFSHFSSRDDVMSLMDAHVFFGDCEIDWRYEEEMNSFLDESVTVNGHVFQVRPSGEDDSRYNGFLKDECLGEIDYETWEIIGPCLE